VIRPCTGFWQRERERERERELERHVTWPFSRRYQVGPDLVGLLTFPLPIKASRVV